MFQTEFEFTLPHGYLDEDGTLQRVGIMRRATAADEILPMRDPRVAANEAYLPVILLARVVTRLGNLPQVNPHVIENLYTEDFRYLLELYNRVNGADGPDIECPQCHHRFRPGGPDPGES